MNKFAMPKIEYEADMYKRKRFKRFLETPK